MHAMNDSSDKARGGAKYKQFVANILAPILNIDVVILNQRCELPYFTLSQLLCHYLR